ncbi:MAG TPA: hypothetical protein DHV55_10825 [Clostridiaceae bacterium]|nr:hypothetical protein [Clostridiaceae bacterium]
MEGLIMLVVKKNGSLQEFNIEKIRTSVNNCLCSDDCYMTEGDINALSTQVNRILTEVSKGNAHTSTYEIRGIVYHVLMENGFKEVAKSYMKLC